MYKRLDGLTCFHAGPKEGWAQFRLEPPNAPVPVRGKLFLRNLIYEDERGRTCLEYDKPSSLFDQFNDTRIASVAAMLDRKLEDLVAAAVEKSVSSCPRNQSEPTSSSCHQA